MASFHKKINFLRGLLGGNVAYTGPFFVNVDLTRRCNLHCLGCRFHSFLVNPTVRKDFSEIQDLPLPFFEKLCGQLEKMGTGTITLTGEGEPFLHRCLPDILAVAKRAGFQVNAATNGTLLDERNIQALIDSHVDFLRVSLLAATPRDYPVNYPGTDPVFFFKVVEGLKLLARTKAERKSRYPVVVLHHPIHRANFRMIHSVVELAHETDVDAMSFSPWKTFRGEFASWSLTRDDEQTLRQSLKRIGARLDSLSIKHNIAELIRRYDIGCEVWRKVPCYIGWSHARILVDGTVLACHRSKKSMGNLHEESFEKIWNGSAYRAFRAKARDQGGAAPIDEDCDCCFCGFVINNFGVHQYFRWLLPFAARSSCRTDRS